MYLTAHRLVTPLGDEGVNAFLHLHGDQFAWPDDPAPLATSNPGEIVERNTEVPPGGNRVLAYLDVLAPDGTPAAEIRAALLALAGDLDGRANPTWSEQDRITVKFGVEKAIERKGTRQSSLKELTEALGRLLARREGD